FGAGHRHGADREIMRAGGERADRVVQRRSIIHRREHIHRRLAGAVVHAVAHHLVFWQQRGPVGVLLGHVPAQRGGGGHLRRAVDEQRERRQRGSGAAAVGGGDDDVVPAAGG